MSERINEIIVNVKEYLSMGEKEFEQSLFQIENQIDDKNLQIRDIFSRNLDSVIKHYLQYQQITTSQRKIETMCESFSQKIAKTEGLSHYDEQLIQRGQKNLNMLRAKKSQIDSLRQSVRLLKKAASCIAEQRYSNAIKQLNLYRQRQNPLDTPLKKTVSIFVDKIKMHLTGIIDGFWLSNQPKIMDIGTHCYNKIELSTHEKTNIYQAFFGRNSTVRNSLIRKSSIIDEGKGQAPLRFLKKIKNQQILEKFILRINVEMNSLKQTKMLCKQMKQQQYFQSILIKQTRKVVTEISKSISCETEADLKKLLSNYIGFLLFRREVFAYFNIIGDNKQTLTLMYSLIGDQAKTLVQSPSSISQILNVKQILDIFNKVLEIVDLDSKSSAYSQVLLKIFTIYCQFSLQQYQNIICQQINEDNLMGYKSQSEVQQKVIKQVLGLDIPMSGYYNFTSFVMYVIQMFTQYYDRMVAFVKDEEFDKSQLHNHLASLLQRIIAVYGGQLVMKDHPLQISQGEVNLLFCEQIFIHFSNELQQKHEYMRKSPLLYKQKLQSVTIQLRRRMREIVQQKITMMMSSYQQPSVWLSEYPNSQPNEFVTWMLEFIKEVLVQMRRIGNRAHQQMAYSWIGYIAQLYWEYFEECSQFTLITVYNLDLDLMHIYKFLSQNFSFYPELTSQLKPLSQFYDLMLRNNIQELLDKQKRDILYSHMDIYKIVPILKKYNKCKGNGGGKIRELKKRDVQNVVKKIESETKLLNAVISLGTSQK